MQDVQNLNVPRPHLRLSGWFSELMRTIVFVVSVTVLFDLAVPRSLVDGRSMEPNFHDGERLIISRLNYLFGAPQRGDIIVFNSMDLNEPDVMLIKRVIGLPGETVEIRDKKVYINGVELEEPYINEPCATSCSDRSWQLGLDEYFVMGDNRNHSKDSRAFNAVKHNHIVGRVLLRYWPPSGWGVINH